MRGSRYSVLHARAVAATPGPTVLGRDSLAEASSGVHLASHAPSGSGSSGGAWHTVNSGDTPVSLASGAGFVGTGTTAHCYLDGTYGTAPDYVECTIKYDADDVAGVAFYVQPDLSYEGYFLGRVSGAWGVYRVDSGNTLLGTVAAPFSTGQTYTLRLARTVSGGTVTLTPTINGVDYVPLTDASYSGALYGGLLAYNATNSTFTNFARGGTAATPPGAATRNSYGDSQTAGSVSTAWPTLYSNDTGNGVYNRAHSGDQALDQALVAYNDGEPGSSHSTFVAVGTNDQRTGGYGSDATKRGVFRKALSALIGWRSLTDKRYATSATTGGTWAATPIYLSNTVGRNTTSSGATLTFAGVTGDVIYVGYTVQNGQSGTWKVKVDGVDKATGTSDPGASITTVNGLSYGPQLLRIAGCGAGSHTVVVETTNTGVSYIDWVAGIDDQAKTNHHIYVGNVTELNSTGYSSFGVDSTNTAAFNSAIAAEVSAWAGDGFAVALVDLHAISPLTLVGDGLHWDDAMEQRVADAFAAAE